MREFVDVHAYRAAVGEVLGVSGWRDLPQSDIDGFATVTGDHQWIHVDVDRAGDGPFGRTIAHGFLTLSLVNVLNAEIFAVHGLAMGVNYGVNRVRFPAPLLVDSRIRATATLESCDETRRGFESVVSTSIESDTADRPVCVAQVVSLLVPAVR